MPLTSGQNPWMEYSRGADFGTPVNLVTANTKTDGTGTNGTDFFQVFYSDYANSSILDYIRIIPWGTQPGKTVATTIRFFVTGALQSTYDATSAFLIAEQQIPIMSVADPVIANAPIDVVFNQRVFGAYYIFATTHVAPAANTGWRCLAIGGIY